MTFVANYDAQKCLLFTTAVLPKSCVHKQNDCLPSRALVLCEKHQATPYFILPAYLTSSTAYRLSWNVLVTADVSWSMSSRKKNLFHSGVDFHPTLLLRAKLQSTSTLHSETPKYTNQAPFLSKQTAWHITRAEGKMDRLSHCLRLNTHCLL